jgi:hypothetical protein
MARLPTPGSDDGTWGQVLNDFLAVAHDSDGTIKTNAVDSSAIQDNSVSGTKLQNNSITNAKLDSGSGSDGQVLTKDTASSGGFRWTSAAGSPDATTSTKGLVQLAGDLGGTASAPTVPGLAGKEPTITAGTTAQYYRGDKTFQTLDKSAVGLANVDNTSDASKPVSTAQQTALNLKADKSTTIAAGTGLFGGGDLSTNRTISATFGTSAGTIAQGNDSRIAGAEQTANKGVASGYASLDGTTKVPIAQLPTGTSSTTVAIGNDSRITGAEQTVNKGAASGYASLDGTTKVPIAQLPTGTSGTTVAIGNDSRITGAEQTVNKGAANGYAGLNASTHVPTAQLGSGTADTTTYLRGDNTWATVSGGGAAVTPTNGGGETYHDIGNSGTAATADLANGNVQKLTLTGNCTLTLTSPAAGAMRALTLLVFQDVTGSRTITWPAAVKWGIAGAPTLSTAATKMDIVSLFTVDGGTNWYGALGAKGY